MKKLELNTYRKVYKVKHDLTDEQESSVIENSPLRIKDEVMDFASSISWADIDEYNAVVVLSEIEKFEFNRLVNLCGINYEFTDITESVILDKIHFDEWIFKSCIEPFLVENLTLDIVLDKINLVGFDGLSQVDKEVLERLSSLSHN